MNGEVADVGLDRLHVGLNEAVDLDELEESAHRDAAHIHQQDRTFFLNAYHFTFYVERSAEKPIELFLFDESCGLWRLWLRRDVIQFTIHWDFKAIVVG